MEVTKTNFDQVLPQVEEAINNATFVTIDCEFTGLNTVSDVNLFDSQRQYYEKVRNTSKDFLVIQYGISAFRYDEAAAKFKQKSYTFYIFRRPLGKNLADQRFLCQTSSIDLLISNGFDFNKLFKDGIPYLNLSEEAKYKENLEEAQKIRANNLLSENQQNGNHIPIPKDDAPFVNQILDQIKKFIDSDEKEVTLPRCNAFIRRLVYQTVHEKFKDKVSLETRTVNRDKIFVATKPKTKDEKQNEERERVKGELKDLDDALGFTKVLRALVNANKLIVGHNMCLDVLHTIDKFLTPLPEDYEEFKECAHGLFTKVLDTKFMCSSSVFKQLIPSTVLAHVLEKVREEPFSLPEVEIEEGFSGYSLNNEKEHEAGYDAYITGLCLLGMWNYLGRENGVTEKDTFKNYDLLQPYINRLFLMRLQDAPYIHLGGDDPNPSRDHVFYLTFPKEWKTNDIVQLFSPFGNVSIGWVNSTSAYVGLYRREQAAVALSTLAQSDRYTIMTYSKKQAQLLGLKTVPVSPKPKQRTPESLKVNPPKKKRKLSISKRSIEPIKEELEETSSTPVKDKKLKKAPVPLVVEESGRKRRVSKTFQEDNSWD